MNIPYTYLTQNDTGNTMRPSPVLKNCRIMKFFELEASRVACPFFYFILGTAYRLLREIRRYEE